MLRKIINWAISIPWKCSNCTTWNSGDTDVCEICRNKK